MSLRRGLPFPFHGSNLTSLSVYMSSAALQHYILSVSPPRAKWWYYLFATGWVVLGAAERPVRSRLLISPLPPTWGVARCLLSIMRQDRRPGERKDVGVPNVFRI